MTAETLNDSTDPSGVRLTRTVTTVPGTLALDSTALRYGRNENCTWRFTPTDTTNYETITGTVDVTVNDSLEPTGEVSIKESAWSTFLSTITFGWYKLTDKVRITASDSGSGVDKVYYFIHESNTPLSRDEVIGKDASDWTEYSGPIAIDHDARCIVYVKIEDVYANKAYISSDGLSFDSTAPTIDGATDGASYVYGNNITLSVTDGGELDTVKINGETKTSSETIQDAGSYTVTATDKAGNTSTIAFTITKAPINVGASIEGWTYGGTASTPSVTGNTGNGTVTYEYKVQGAADSTYTTTVPVNHGDYTLRATVAATDNYQGGSATADFSIAKADATLSQAPAAVADLSYTGSLQDLVTAGTVTGGTIQYKLGASGTYGTSVPKAKDAGDYTVYYKVTGDQNHNDIAETSVAVSIAQQTTSITTTPVSKHYGDSAFAITGVTNNVGATPTYAVTAGTDVISLSGSTVTILKPGSATITASIPVSTNYTAATATIAVTVANGAQPAQPAATMTTAYANDTVSKVSLPTGWTWVAADRDTALTVGTAVTAHAEYTADDAAYYDGGKSLEIAITRQAQPVTPAPSTPSTPAATVTPSAPAATAAATTTTTPDLSSLVLTPVAGAAAATANTVAAANRDAGNDTAVAGSRTESSQPHLEGHEGLSSWNDIADVIKESSEAAAEEKTLSIEIDRDAKIPAAVFEAAKGSDVTLVFEMGDGITWSVKGTDITDGAAASMDFGVTRDSHNIPNEVAGTLAGDHFSTQISLDFDGPFGFTATLTMDMGSENAGKIANLFYFDPDTNNLEFIYAGEIGENGSADLEFTHASDYLIVVADESMETAVIDTSAGNTESSSGGAVVATEAPEKGWNPIWIILLVGVVIIVGIGMMMVKNKEEK
ncbi:MAG: hypothetical protein K6A69_07820 [Lachnospiraceae bacterium]|nr:hypothetical protein [Lachnospiraceae bacterium]